MTLTPAAQRLYRELVTIFGGSPEVRQLARSAVEFWQRAEEAAALVAAEGLTVATPKGTYRHPAVQIERDSRLGYLAALRLLRGSVVRTKLGRPSLVEQHRARFAAKYCGPA
jgi:hypothetical protein